MSKLTGHPAFSLLSRAHSPTLASSILSDELLHKPLKLLPTTAANRPSDVRQARQRAREARKATQARKNRKPKPLTAKEKRELGLHTIPLEQRKWDVFEPLHKMWLEYMREVLAIKGKEKVFMDAKAAGPLITAADMHGAMVRVVKCRCVGRVGTEGIVAKETRGTFEIITRRNELKGEIFGVP
jgi:ribonuclease P protein subunit POP4